MSSTVRLCTTHPAAAGIEAVPSGDRAQLGGSAQRLAEIGEDVVDVLDADREADIAVRHAGLLLLGRGQLRMRGAGGMDRQAARIADIGDVVEELERVDELATGLAAVLQLEADQPAIAALEVGIGAPA